MKTSPNISINKEKPSPYWMLSFIGADGKQKRRSTKVPVVGGLFEGENLTRAQAEKRALIVGAQIACTETQNYISHDNTTVNNVFARYLRSASKRAETAKHPQHPLSLHPTLHASSSPQP